VLSVERYADSGASSLLINRLSRFQSSSVISTNSTPNAVPRTHNRRNRGEGSRFVGEEQFQLKRSARLDDGAAFHPASTHGEVPEGPFPFSSYDIYG